MKKQIIFAVALSLFFFNVQFSSVQAQGSLTPSGPPAAGMKTLSQIEPRTPISSLPYAINYPGSYYVTTNMTGTSGSYGIYITSGNVTLDLGGYTVQGVPSSNSGIYVAGACTNLVICNGNVTGWGGQGVDIEASAASRNITISRINASLNSGSGIYVGNVTAVTVCGQIIGCNCSSNLTGIYANDCRVENCRSENNASYGYYLTRSQLLNSSAEYNGITGVWLEGIGNGVRGCHVSYNSGQGIYFNGATTGGNLVADNLVVSNSSVGIQVNGSGSVITGNNIILNQSSAVLIYGNNNRIDNNNIQTSGSFWGIGVNSSALTNNVVVRNTVFGSTANYYNPGNNDFGPIGAASTNTSPWGNISH